MANLAVRILAYLSVLSAGTGVVHGQAPDPLASNRPGLSESEELLGPREWQVESGLTFTSLESDDGRHEQWDFPELTLRAGITRRLELFFNATGLWIDTTRSNGERTTTTGGSDIQPNVKLGIWDQERHPLTLSIAAGVSLPTGAEAFSSGSYDPSVRVLWARTLPRTWWINGNLVFSDTTIEENRRMAGGASVGTGRSLSSSVSWYVELFGNITQHDTSLWRLNGGVAVVTTPDLQFDLSAGRALRDGPPSWFVSGGISVRRR